MNSELSFSKASCHTKAEELYLPYYLPIAGGRIIGFIPFPRVLVLCEKQSVEPGYELVSSCPFPMMITITPRPPPSIYYESFSYQRCLMVSLWNLSDSKSTQVPRTLLSILANLNNAVIWMISTRPLISKSSSLCTNPLVAIPSAPITTGISVTFTFHSFFNSLAMSRYLSLFYLSFSFTLWSAGITKSTTWQVLIFLLTITRSGHLTDIGLSVCNSKSQRTLCVSFSRMDSELCIYHLFMWSNLNFLHNSQWSTFSIQSCLVLFSFCANLLNSLIMWLIVSSLSPLNLHLLFFASCLFLLWHS